MQAALQICGTTLIVRLTGELDHHGAGQVREVIESAIKAKNVRNLIFDFTALSFMDSSGIGMIIGRYKLIRALGGKVALVCGTARMEKLITMSGLTKLIAVHKSVDDALKEVCAG